MIRFEFCEGSTSRNASTEAKVISAAMAAPKGSAMAQDAEEAFALEMETPPDEAATDGRTRRGRSKKMRGS